VTSSNSAYTVDKYLSSLDESDGEKEEKKGNINLIIISHY